MANKQIIAAEKALGLEPIGLETKAEANLRRAWEQRFAPLGLAIREEMPPDDMLLRILRRVDRSRDVAALRTAKKRASRWRLATVGAAALAAGLAYFAIAPMLKQPATPPETQTTKYVAVITPEGGEASLIVEVDLRANTALVRPVSVETPAEKDLELWRIPKGADPLSLGVVAGNEITEISLEGEPGDTIAITYEPEGGSPDGKPSGPPVYSGTLVEVPQ